MSKNNGSIKAKEFLNKYRPAGINSDTLKNILEQLGYIVAEFGSNEDSDTIISELKLRNYADNSRGFTYADSNYRIVFVNEGLSEEEKCIVLAHETGHIFCGHLSTSPVIGKDVTEEYEANEFVHKLLNPNIFTRVRRKLAKHKLLTLFCTVVVILTAVTAAVSVYEAMEQKYYGKYYVTDSGTKYHTEDCYIIKDKSNKRRLTNEDIQNGYYEPCEICIE